MTRWAAIIQYADFWDVPRTAVFEVDGKLWLIVCDFIVADDEFDDCFNLYEVPTESSLRGSWSWLKSLPATPLKRIPVRLVRFDETRRRAVDLDSIGL